MHTTSPTVFHNSRLFWNKDAQQLTLQREDGVIYRFNEFLVLTEVEDKQRHGLTLGRDSHQTNCERFYLTLWVLVEVCPR